MNAKKPASMEVRLIKSSAGGIAKAEAPVQLTAEKGNDADIWITPPLDLKGLKQFVEHSSILPQCINAYRNNIAGFGIGVKYIEDKDETPEMAAEFERMTEIVELLTLEQDTKELIENIVEARETYGIAYLEIIRDPAGEVVQADFIEETPSIRKSIPLDPYIETTFYHHGQATERKKRFRKYKQTISGSTVYFKEFGDPRIMDATTGKYLADGETLEIDKQANEILEFKIGTAPYGQVRWIGQILGVDGARRAEELNNNYFINGRHTPLLIVVRGGTLTEESFTKLQTYVDEIKGESGQHAFLILEAEGTNGSLDFEQEPKPEIEIKDLAGILQKDELFQDYIDNHRKKVQSSFLLPDLYVGYTTDFNRATAQTAQEVTEQQVFQPERGRLAWRINHLLLNDYQFKEVEVYFKAPDINNPDDLARILNITNAAGGLTPNKAKEILYKALGEVSENYTEPWGDIPLAISKQANAAQQPQQTQQIAQQVDSQIAKALEKNDTEIVAILKEVKNFLKNFEKDFTFLKKGSIIKGDWNEDAHPRDEHGRFTSGGGSTISSTGVEFQCPTPERFMSLLKDAKQSQPEKTAWRVDDYSHTAEEYGSDKLYSTEGGSVVAVTEDGDIISVCRAMSDAGVSGRDLLQMAVDNGGTKLDAFSGLYGFYRKCGFEPVSWCEFSKDFAPPGWKEGRDEEEPIIFWKYTGDKSTLSTNELKAEMNGFLSSTTGFSGDDGYENAMNARNSAM